MQNDLALLQEFDSSFSNVKDRSIETPIVFYGGSEDALDDGISVYSFHRTKPQQKRLQCGESIQGSDVPS